MSEAPRQWFLDVGPVVVVAGAAAVPEPKGGMASATIVRWTPRRCPDLSCVERHGDDASRELLTVRTGPAPQSWRR